MIVGIIGVGVVGGTLKQWFEEFTSHDIRCHDPLKGLNDSLVGCDAIFISIPVPPLSDGQDLRGLREAVNLAKQHAEFVFIRSTALPGTSDELGCIAMPEYLTERQAYEDMKALPVLCGPVDEKLLDRIFPNKRKIIVPNKVAELAKYTHNCFGAFKVTYFNIIYDLSKAIGVDFDLVKACANLTGFIEPQHTQVPGPDGAFGYGGKCFPENMDAMKRFLHRVNLHGYGAMFEALQRTNEIQRFHETKTKKAEMFEDFN